MTVHLLVDAQDYEEWLHPPERPPALVTALGATGYARRRRAVRATA